MIKTYQNFLNEDRLYLYNRKFRAASLFNAGIYTTRQIKKWMKEYNFDEYAHCVLVSKTIPGPELDTKYSLPKTSRDIKNLNYFSTNTKKYEGYMPEDSKLIINEQEVFLYIFKKNSNPSFRARQLHGFIYEGEVKRINGLAKLKKTHKWDAEGGLDKVYLTHRLDQGRNLEIFDGSSYQSLVKLDEVTGFKEVDFSKVPEDFTDHLNWSIKCMANRTDVEMGDFKRIAGIEKSGREIKIIDSNEKNFMLAVAFHDGSTNKNIIEEYIILVPISTWKTFLPDLNKNLAEITNMYNDLSAHKLLGERSDESETAWREYMERYKKLCNESDIKLRFKRDSKGQLRIQCSFSYNSFKNKVLRIPHIKIS